MKYVSLVIWFTDKFLEKKIIFKCKTAADKNMQQETTECAKDCGPHKHTSNFMWACSLMRMPVFMPDQA